MNEYSLGKDIGEILRKLEALSELMTKTDPCKSGCGTTSVAVVLKVSRSGTMQVAGKSLQYKEFDIPRTEAGKCSVNDRAAGVKVRSDGWYFVTLHYECKHKTKTCRTDLIEYVLSESEGGESTYRIKFGALESPPESTYKVEQSGTEDSIRDAFERINYLRVAISNCST